MKDFLSVLVTGAGAPGIRGTIHALRKNSDGCRVRIVGVDAKPDTVGQFLSDRFYQVPAPEDRNYISVLRSICKEESVQVVIPQTTRELLPLSRHKGILLDQGVRVMVSDPEAIVIANNKRFLLEQFEKLSLPVPDYRLAGSEDALVESVHALGYPQKRVVVKPPISSGMRGVRVLDENAWDVQRFLNEKPSGLEISLKELTTILRRGSPWPELLVMEYMPGPEYSVDVFVGEKLKIAIPRLRRSIRSGITFTTSLEFSNDLSVYSLRAAEHIGLRYAFGFQYKLDSRGVGKILECNPRVQGTMVASTFSGVNVIWSGVRELQGQPPCDAPRELKTARFYRYWGGVGIFEDNVVEI